MKFYKVIERHPHFVVEKFYYQGQKDQFIETGDQGYKSNLGWFALPADWFGTRVGMTKIRKPISGSVFCALLDPTKHTSKMTRFLRPLRHTT